MNRRQFLKTTGSAAIGAAIISVVGVGVWRMFNDPKKLFYGSQRSKSPELLKEDGEFVSPYRRTFGFEVTDKILAMAVNNGSIYIATPTHIYIYGMSGEVMQDFATDNDLRDLAIFNDQIYALFANKVEVYDRLGQQVTAWEACSDNSDYCSFAVCAEGVFVTDVANKNICKYNLDGTLARFINSPSGTILPSPYFAITENDGMIYCANPGRHLIEQYTTDGEFVQSFGKAGAQAGAFSGCCNPARLSAANHGELLTSEKGIPRISCYAQDGTFRSILLDAKALGGGKEAYQARIMGDKLVVTGQQKVSIFQYNRNLSQQTACGQCTKDCPLKVNI